MFGVVAGVCEKLVDEALAFVGARIGEEALLLVGRREESPEVEVGAADKEGVGDRGFRRDAVAAVIRGENVVDAGFSGRLEGE